MNQKDKDKNFKGTMLLFFFLTRPHMYGYVDKLFEMYKNECWHFFEMYRNNKAKNLFHHNKAYILDSPIKQYIQCCKTLSLLNYSEFLQKNNNVDDKEKFDIDLYNTSISALDKRFVHALEKKDKDAIFRFFSWFLKYAKDKEKILDYYIVLQLAGGDLLSEMPLDIYSEISTVLNMVFREVTDLKIYPKDFVSIFTKENDDIDKNLVFKFSKLKMGSVKCITDFESVLFDMNYTDFVNDTRLLLSCYGINVDAFDTMFEPNKTDVLNISYLLHNKEDENYIWLFLVLICVCKAYQQAREFLLEQSLVFYTNNQKDVKKAGVEYKKIIKSLEQTIKRQEGEINKKEQQLNNIKKSYRTSLEMELIEKDKEIDRLELLLEQALVKKINENIEQTKNNVEHVYTDKTISLDGFTMNDSMVIVGGYPKLIQKLKSYYPNLINIQDTIGAVKKNCPYFLLTQYTEHKMTFLLQSNKIQYTSINSIGVNQIAYEIRNALTKK